jgi:hypothetical protein
VRQAAQHGNVVSRQIVGRAFVLAQPGQLLRTLAMAQAGQRLPEQSHLAAVRQ